MNMADSIRYGLSPVLFAKELLNIEPDAWQQKVMMSNSTRTILLCSRQSGKSTSSAIIALHTALFRPDSLILLVSPSERQSKELFKKIRAFYKLLPGHPELTEDNKLSLTFQNDSRIVALPGTQATIRGFSAPALVIEDEAAQCDDQLFTAILPMLAVSNGKLMLLSTPYGKRGHFYDSWNDGDSLWERVMITAHDCPRISDEFLAEQRLKMSEWEYKQEYLCEFGETLNSIFSYDTIMGAMDSSIKPLFPVSGHAPGGLKGLCNVSPLFPGG